MTWFRYSCEYLGSSRDDPGELIKELCDDAGVANPVAALLVALESERLPARNIFVEMILVAAAS